MAPEEGGTAGLLRRFLELFWLRPEVALWRTSDAIALRQVGCVEIDFDLGCGDGLNSYVLAGGQLPLDIDDFLEIQSVDAQTFFAGRTDIYDAPVAREVTVPPPPRRIRVGLDLKQHLLDKADRLNLYDRLIQHDANNQLPLPESSASAVFSNVLYWIEHLDILLREITRVLRPEGTATVLVPDSAIRQFMFYDRFVVNRGWRWMEALDKGRHTHIRHHGTYEEWTARFEKAGLRVEGHVPYMSSRLVEIHEIGLRPLSPVLIKMASRLAPADRAEIKREWVDYCMALALPMFESGWLDEPGLSRAFHAFALKRA